jgi:hypothetical protein
LASPARLTDFEGVPCNKLIHDGTLALARSQQSTHSLHVFSLSEGAAHDNGDVGVRDVEALVEYPRRHERPEVPAAEALQHVITLWPADVARQRHDEMLACDGIRRFVVSGEDQHPGMPVAA